jgi:serine/threonine-protein kinase HipA
LLGLPQGETGAYSMLADGIRQFGNDVPGDLRELWRRLVFSLLASNYDDHLRNHGFLMREASTLDTYATAFEHSLLNEARSLAGA